MKKNVNLPNFLTILRIVLVPLCVYALFKDGGDNSTWRIGAWCGYFIIGVTDILDGRIARSRGNITSFGTFLDPVADKVAIGSALISLSILHRLWWWVSIVILFRELAVTVLRLAVIKRGVIPASKGGKLKTLFQGFGTGFYILPFPHWLSIPRDIFMAIALLLTVGTGVDYFYQALIRPRKSK
jgi:CDP-diacylglycerol--glycerol-3-phosphate 3-phosphatidyltransferase